MNTEKSIKLLKVIKDILPEHYNFDFGKPEIDEVINRLQMWEDLKSKYGTFYRDTEEGRCLGEMMGIMEYQNFSKSIKRTVTFNIELNNIDLQTDVIMGIRKCINNIEGVKIPKGIENCISIKN